MSVHIGWRADASTGAETCSVVSTHECRSLQASGGAGGFDYPSSSPPIAQTVTIYVADLDNDRVQEFTASGTFVSMFGSGLNRSRDRRAAATPAERNVCTASEDVYASGTPGTAAGQLKYVGSIAVDPASGDVYVLERDIDDYRVDKYTAGGRFLWTVGKDVNTTTKGDFCGAAEVDSHKARCAAGREDTRGGLESRAFKFAPQYGDLLAAGGPYDLPYVGDEHRVQELYASGR